MSRGGGRTRTSSNQTSQSTSTVSTPGTAFGTDVLGDVQGADLQGQVLDLTPYTGTFVPQQTATATPMEAQQTFVPTNYEPGIQEGLTAAGATSASLPSQVSGLRDYWSSIIGGGGQNPFLEDVISSIETDFGEQSARGAGQRALYAGSEGAFGGTPMQQNETWIADQEAQALGGITSGIRYQDYLNTQGLMQQAPSQLAQIAELGTLGADQMLEYGGLQQQNLQDAAATGDYNAQVLLNNLNRAQQLNDANAIAQAQDDIARWESERDNLGQQISMLSEILGLSRGVPGATTTSAGTASGTSTTREGSSADWGAIAQVVASIIGAMFSSSDRRVKKNLVHTKTDNRGIRWYKFHYLWQEDDEPQYEGVIAQELLEIAPEFVINFNGLLMVNYFALATWRLKDALADCA